MSLVQTYLEDNGYDYYGNAAEDTLLFFVHDENAPTAEEPGRRSNEVITNAPGDIVNEVPDKLSSGIPADTADSNMENGDPGDSVPRMTEMDAKQTNTEHSTDKNFKS